MLDKQRLGQLIDLTGEDFTLIAVPEADAQVGVTVAAGVVDGVGRGEALLPGSHLRILLRQTAAQSKP